MQGILENSMNKRMINKLTIDTKADHGVIIDSEGK